MPISFARCGSLPGWPERDESHGNSWDDWLERVHQVSGYFNY
jgi:hypothetical protein